MSGKVIVVFALLVALLSSAAYPVQAKEALQHLMVRREKMTHLNGRAELAPRGNAAQVQRRAQLSEDERGIITKQVMQAISEMTNSECVSDRDYQGWLDFGRRDAD